MSPGRRPSDQSDEDAGPVSSTPGLYDKLLDAGDMAMVEALESHRMVADLGSVEAAELPDRVADVVADWIRRRLGAVPSGERAAAALHLTGSIAELIEGDAEPLVDPIERLLAVEHRAPTGDPVRIDRPLTPLRDTVLMTNARDQANVGNEIQAEIASADRIDLILAFIRWSGIRTLIPHLGRQIEQGRQVRIITTVYTGSTELRALQELAGIGAQVRVSYDVSTTRLHAKAWLFHRESGFSTMYVGSSNLTFSAQVTGLEWNVRASERRNPELIEAFRRTFETYWADDHFEPFEPVQFRQATETSSTGGDDSIATPFHLSPYPFQRRMLDQLAVERNRGHNRNLVVAATGTGKTVLAAFDYQRLRSELERSRLLFVAHRREILRQSQATFRHVLRDGSFGERWVDGERPAQWQHVFASIQSLNASDVSAIDPTAFDVVIVDEFHHAAAASYRAVLEHLEPRRLIGLTATPERADGLSVLEWFDDRVAVELRLWDALEQGLLSPFHYFGVHDQTDLSPLTWRRGTGYDVNELTNLYTADDLWVARVLGEVADKVAQPTQMRALGFCVGIDHAEFMAARFNQAGIAARAVTSRTSSADRQESLRALAAGTVNVLFTVDLFNEGVDVPVVDVVLMLRPTESATVFLQQLGRGLRRAEGKDVLTVLDFVGHQSKQFRFDLRFRQLLGRTRRQLQEDVETGFPFLPAGCQIELDRVTADIVLDNIRSSLPSRWPEMVAEARRLGDVTLAEFLTETGLELTDLYRNGRTMTELRRAAGLVDDEPALPVAVGDGGSDGEPAIAVKTVARGLSRLTHVDDQARIDTYRRLLSGSEPFAEAALDEPDLRRLEGLLLTVLSPGKATFESFDQAAAALWAHPRFTAEILEMLDVLDGRVDRLHPVLDVPVPLSVHGHYTREEILAAFGASTAVRPMPLQTGVYWHEETRTDLLFITLQKTERDYSPTTRYLDCAISDRLFHWESQANTTAASQRGISYIEHERQGRNVVLFIRKAKTVDGRTAPYLCAGGATYVEHRSEKPMQITWRLDHRLPGDIFADYRAAVA